MQFTSNHNLLFIRQSFIYQHPEAPPLGASQDKEKREAEKKESDPRNLKLKAQKILQPQMKRQKNRENRR